VTVSCLAGALTHSVNVKACKLSLVATDPCQKFASGNVRKTWKYGGEALYFRDPDGHLLEVVTPGVWSIFLKAAKSVFLPHRLIPGMRVIAFTGVDLVAVLMSDDLDFPELSIPVLVLRVVAEAVLVMKFV
jgi:hypothetical protein